MSDVPGLPDYPTSPLQQAQFEEWALREQQRQARAEHDQARAEEFDKEEEARSLRAAQGRIQALRTGEAPPQEAEETLPTPPLPSLFQPQPPPPAKVLPPEAGVFANRFPPMDPKVAEGASPASRPPGGGGYQAVRMPGPGGKIVFTNLAQTGGTVLGEQEGRQAARNIGMGGEQVAELQAPPGELSGAGLVNYFDKKRLRDLVRTSQMAPDRPGQLLTIEPSPDEYGNTTPGYDEAARAQAESKVGRLGAHTAIAEAQIRAKEAEDWAHKTPDERRRAEAAYKAAERPNLPEQSVEAQLARLQGIRDAEEKIRQIIGAVNSALPNTDNPATARLRAQRIGEELARAGIDPQKVADARKDIELTADRIFKANPLLGLGGAGTNLPGTNIQ